jgi:hypothetical protein
MSLPYVRGLDWYTAAIQAFDKVPIHLLALDKMQSCDRTHDTYTQRTSPEGRRAVWTEGRILPRSLSMTSFGSIRRILDLASWSELFEGP